MKTIQCLRLKVLLNKFNRITRNTVVYSSIIRNKKQKTKTKNSLLGLQVNNLYIQVNKKNKNKNKKSRL